MGHKALPRYSFALKLGQLRVSPRSRRAVGHSYACITGDDVDVFLGSDRL
ncbi:MAG: hypothetical protein V7L05_14250 [Nostoc sp.]